MLSNGEKVRCELSSTEIAANWLCLDKSRTTRYCNAGISYDSILTQHLSQEHILNSDPMVKAAIMFGRSRFHNGVLIEPAPEHPVDLADEEKIAEFRNAVWYVESKIRIVLLHS